MNCIIHRWNTSFLKLISFLPFIISLFLISCTNSKKVTYFRDVPDSLGEAKVMDAIAFTESKIQPHDMLNISVQTTDLQATEAINKGTNVKVESGGGSSLPAYIVDKDGFIEMPIVGRVQVANHTTTEAKDIIREKAKKYYVEPIINVTYANFYITILGDISHPGRFVIPNEKISIIDAIGLASDMSITGKRQNILLIREEGGKRVFARYNINSTEIFNSPYYYLRSGDVLYIEPINPKKRAATADATRDRYISYFISLVSLSLSVYSIILIRN